MNCSISVICYHCGKGQKEKVHSRVKTYRSRNPLIRKLDTFNQLYKKKGLFNKVTHFNRTKENSDVTVKLVLEKLCQDGQAKCYLTGEEIDISQSSTYSFDHIIPVAKGGNNQFSNLGICTQEINMAKSDKTPEEFFELCKKVLIHNGYTVNKLAPTLGNAPS